MGGGTALSVVVPVRNGLPFTIECLAALLPQCGAASAAVVVADGRSDDGSAEYLEALSGVAPLRWIRNPGAVHFARNCNLGARAAEGDFLLLLNNDLVPDPGFLDALAARLRFGGADIAGALLRYPGGDRIQHAGVAFTPKKLPVHLYHGLPLSDPAVARAATRPRECPAVTGAALAVRRDLFERLGGFDENFRNGLEDIDLCLRARAEGARVFFEPRATGIHHESATPGRFAHCAENESRFLARWASRIVADDWRIYREDGFVLRPGPDRRTLVPIPAAPPPGPPAPRVSIVVPVWNGAADTARCLASLRRSVRLPYEVVLVDQGSTDETLYLAAADPYVRIVAFPENRGFAAGANAGIEAARAPVTVVLNNDTIVPPGAVELLVEALARLPEAGAVGPVTDWARGPQRIPAPRLSDYEAVRDFAAAVFARERGRVVETDRLVGFCLAAPTALLRSLGGFDASFGIGGFEDDDLSYRIRAAGKRLYIVRGAFVRHLGERTFARQGIDPDRVLAEGRKVFLQKWGGLSASRRIRAAPSPRLTLAMIVRDEADRLSGAVESVAGLADDLVVVDTGSRDGTPDAAEALGARVVRHPWNDDFAAARNAGLAAARGRWILVLDADERLDAEGLAEIARVLDGPPAAYRMTTRNYTDAVDAAGFVPAGDDPRALGFAGWFPSEKVRLFPNLPSIRFEGAIHETVDLSCVRAGIPIARLSSPVHHYGRMDREKRARYLRIAEAHALATDPRTQADLGRLYLAEGRIDEAIAAFRRAVALAPHEARYRFDLGTALHKANRFGEAEAAYRDSLALDPALAEAHNNLAALYGSAGRLEDALREVEAALRIRPDSPSARANRARILSLLRAA